MKKEMIIDYLEEGITQEADYFSIITEDNNGNKQCILFPIKDYGKNITDYLNSFDDNLVKEDCKIDDYEWFFDNDESFSSFLHNNQI